jgi:hypothetical protein
MAYSGMFDAVFDQPMALIDKQASFIDQHRKAGTSLCGGSVIFYFCSLSA